MDDGQFRGDKEIGRIHASAARRTIGVASLGGLGALLLYITLATPPAPGWQAFLIAMGLGALWMAHRTWKATALALILTGEALRDSTGMVLARIDEIERIDRGMFAMKPSNGFALVLRQPRAHAWRPGLWWRLGRRVAVGGMAAAAQTRPLADVMTAMVAERAR